MSKKSEKPVKKKKVETRFTARELGRFGQASEFNNLGVGSLVAPETHLGLRPTFSIKLGLPGSTGGFFASPYPSLSTVNTVGYDWLLEYPQSGSVVYVPGTEPVNIIGSVPYLVEAPVVMTPSFSPEITERDWVGAGLDPQTQAPLWQLPSGQRMDLQANNYGSQLQYINGRTGARYVMSIPHDPFPHTNGIAIGTGIDFVRIEQFFSALGWDDRQLPAGRYRFRVDLFAIPRSFAYEGSQQIPLVDCYKNKNLDGLSGIPSTSFDVVGEIPVNFRVPKVTQMSPSHGLPLTNVDFTGELLSRTNEVAFVPSLPASIQVISDHLVRAQVPSLAQSGQVIVKTARGWVIVGDSFVVDTATVAARGQQRPLVW
ncbi:MAG: hypothetical protein U0941_19640 [Planctomycetaceae bacterium]